jgi:thiosulfate/3-mercaptopyruvate sulfurtransferase
MTALPTPLISVDELAARIGDPALRLVDMRWYLGKPGAGRAAYDAGHLPGAIHLDLDTDLAGPKRADGEGGRHPLPDPTQWARHLVAKGIGDGDMVVAYDDVGGWIAARLWWMLDNLGFEQVAVLDGGFKAWTESGRPTEIGDVDWPKAPGLTLADHWSNTISRDDLRAKLGSVVLLDARGAPRYRGETEPVDPYPGHIPTARNRPTETNLGPEGRFRAAADLLADLEPLFAEGDVVTSCGSGTSALHTSIAARVAGLPDPILYVGSYSEWSRTGNPVVVGAEPGTLEDARVPDRS